MLLFVDGADSLTNNTTMPALKYDYVGSSSVMNAGSTNGVKGGYAMQMVGNSSVGTYPLVKYLSVLAGAGSGNYLYAGFWFKPTTLPTNDTSGDIFYATNVNVPTGFSAAGFSGGTIAWSTLASTVTSLRLTLKSNGVFVLSRNNTTLATGTTALALNTWYWIELKFCVDNTSGTFELRINETVDATYSGDTYDAGSVGLNTVAFATSSANGATYVWDDLIVNDSTGTANNGYAGKSLIQSLYPNGVGTTTQGTPDTGSNYARVQEVSSDGDSSYVDQSTVGHLDTYAFGNTSGTITTVKGVAVNVTCRATGTTTRKTKPQVLSSTVSAQLTERTAPFGSTYKTVQSISETDPSTSAAWTQSAVDAAEFGFSLSA